MHADFSFPGRGVRVHHGGGRFALHREIWVSHHKVERHLLLPLNGVSGLSVWWYIAQDIEKLGNAFDIQMVNDHLHDEGDSSVGASQVRVNPPLQVRGLQVRGVCLEHVTQNLKVLSLRQAAHQPLELANGLRASDALRCKAAKCRVGVGGVGSDGGAPQVERYASFPDCPPRVSIR